MIAVLACVTDRHNLALVLVAMVVCAIGSWSIIRLHRRAFRVGGLQRVGWHFLSAVAAGISIWCTHFVAMLGFDPGVPIAFDAVATIVSLLIALVGAYLGFSVSAGGRGHAAPMIGGAILGITLSAMHYAGIMAYRVQGLITWNPAMVAASVAGAVVFAALSLHFTPRKPRWPNMAIAASCLMLSVLILHFSGMAALTITPMQIEGDFADPAAQAALALAVSVVALIVVGAGIASYLIDDRSRAETTRQLHHLALTDSLTGLPNREAFRQRLEQEVAAAARGGQRIALLNLDLDGFREINDAHDHSAGDEALRQLAARLTSLLREGEFVARIGADEFVAVKRLNQGMQIDGFVQRLHAAVAVPVQLRGQAVTLSTSIGVAFFPEDAEAAGGLVGSAALALARARVEGRGQLHLYQRSMEEAARTRRQLVADLRAAIGTDQLTLHYQPQFAVWNSELRGFEALLRWTHPSRGPVHPAEFIPLAEENGLIEAIGEWVLRRACADAARWQPACKVAVNLSPAQLANPNLPQLVQDILQKTGLPADRLELELTETMILGSGEHAVETLHRIGALGVQVALDDFGTGYSSLETLRAFRFSKIKLDRSFMREVEDRPQAVAIIRAVLAMGRSLGMLVLAEGIETEGQLAILRTEGCDEVQGYLTGHPVPVEALVAQGQIGMEPSPLPPGPTGQLETA
ncbi:putative bifunctional diguanylate cyclase/phosphodiesterase [Roseomonas chloroacetimidivorans]|uniref:putative bifunctional diguanylate cyclase/phosphodiesterase n=1 Tax=Roseomonas chloroacetimidivorans TaxID=1766656 RepID=UPI003C720BAB